MRRALSRGRWGGKWWCPRWFSTVGRRSSVVGVVVSLWLCLVTVVHLSLQPSPLLGQHPCQWRENSALLRRSQFANLRYAMGVVALDRGGAVDKMNLVQPRREPSSTDTDTVGKPRLSRSQAQVGPDQRVLLTKEDNVNDADSDLLLLQDGGIGRGEHQHGYNLQNFDADNLLVKENDNTGSLVEKRKAHESHEDQRSLSSSRSVEDRIHETQLERIPVAGPGHDGSDDGQRQFIPQTLSHPSTMLGKPHVDHPPSPSESINMRHLEKPHLNDKLHSPLSVSRKRFDIPPVIYQPSPSSTPTGNGKTFFSMMTTYREDNSVIKHSSVSQYNQRLQTHDQDQPRHPLDKAQVASPSSSHVTTKGDGDSSHFDVITEADKTLPHFHLISKDDRDPSHPLVIRKKDKGISHPHASMQGDRDLFQSRVIGKDDRDPFHSNTISINDVGDPYWSHVIDTKDENPSPVRMSRKNGRGQSRSHTMTTNSDREPSHFHKPMQDDTELSQSHVSIKHSRDQSQSNNTSDDARHPSHSHTLNAEDATNSFRSQSVNTKDARDPSHSHLTRSNHDRQQQRQLDREKRSRQWTHQTADASHSAGNDGSPSRGVSPRRPVTQQHVTKQHVTDEAVVVGTRLKMDGFLEHAYNVTASDYLPIDRDVPDTRPDGCPLEWPDVTSVGPVSVIICTHNEASSVLRRTVYSVLRQTPSQLLSDVIVVDDNSTIGDPALALEVIGEEVTQGKLRLLRTAGRQGLVRARLLGAEAARGKVLVFLDSHCECGHQWLTPLLTALRHDKRKVVSPYIDVIRSESFAYARSPDNLQGDFNWRLEFGWRAIPLDELTVRDGPHMPIKTPVISGGLFAVDRQFFFDIGAYDELMDIWGGENMELSFRVWMCGGKLEIIPCSRVGHVFRSSVPYSFPGDRRHTVLRNLARAARVWMDEYSPFFFAAVNMSSFYDIGDVTSRLTLRQRLGCQSFEWYLNVVARHLHVPSPLTVQYGQFKNRGSLLCMTSSHSASGLPHLRLLACHGSLNQTVELQQSGMMQVGKACVSLSVNKQLSLSSCLHSNLVWKTKGEQIYLDQTDLCMTSVDNEFVHLQTCRLGDRFQDWEPSFTFTWPT